jgi:SEC-C motif
MLRRQLVPARNLGYHRARRVRCRNDPAFLFFAPAPTPTNADPDINPLTAIRCVNYMVDHMCEPIRQIGSHLAAPLPPHNVGPKDRLRFFDLGTLERDEIPDDIDDRLDADAALIPRMILVLRKLARIRETASRTTPFSRRSKLGRNDPCPCGSGKKYKRCCARA